MLTNLEQDILDIISDHVGYKKAINQHDILYVWNLGYSFGENTTCRQIRKVIANLIRQGYPIISTPKNGGGYCLMKKGEEGIECAKRIKRTAIKLLLKARQIRANSKIKQLKFDI